MKFILNFKSIPMYRLYMHNLIQIHKALHNLKMNLLKTNIYNEIKFKIISLDGTFNCGVG